MTNFVIAEIVKFREMIDGRIERKDPPLTVIPEEHKRVVALLAHERCVPRTTHHFIQLICPFCSDKSIGVISKHIRQELLPVQDEDDEDVPDPSTLLPLETIESAIKSVATRVNYGLDAPSGGKIPTAWCWWRWEIKSQLRDWLPRSVREKADVRQSERIEVPVFLISAARMRSIVGRRKNI